MVAKWVLEGMIQRSSKALNKDFQDFFCTTQEGCGSGRPINSLNDFHLRLAAQEVTLSFSVFVCHLFFPFVSLESVVHLEVLRVLRRCFKDFFRLFQGRFRGLLRVFQGCFKEISWMF